MDIKKIIMKRAPFFYRMLSRIKFAFDFHRHYSFIRRFGKFCDTPDAKNKTIVFNLVRSYYKPVLVFESILALNLSRMGARSYVLIDDSILRCHETFSCDDIWRNDDILFRTKFANGFLKRHSIYKQYSRFIDKSIYQNIPSIAKSIVESGNFIYEGVDLKPHIDASVIRFFQSVEGSVEEEKRYNEIILQCCENALISLLVASGVDRSLEPDIVVTSHGIYSTWGPFYEYFKQKGTEVITYGFSAYKNDAVLLSRKGLVANRCDDGFVRADKNDIAPEVIGKEVHRFLDKRFMGESADLNLFGISTEHDPILEHIQRLAAGRDIFAMFPNVLWDNSLTGVKSVFNSAGEWIIETVRFFENQENKLLVVRIHPAEARCTSTRVNVADVIQKSFNMSLRDFKNIIVIPPENPLSSYALFNLIKAGILYNGGTIGLEMMYKHKPILLAGEAPYSYQGFTVDYKNVKEYFQAFDNVENILKYQERSRESLMKYLYYFFILNDISLSFFNENVFREIKLSIKPEDVLKDNNLTHIAETILGKHQFFQEWANYKA